MTVSFWHGTLVVATRDEVLEDIVERVRMQLDIEPPKLTTVRNLPDCLLAIQLLDPRLLLLDDGIQESGNAMILDRVHKLRPGLAIVYVASKHSLELEREVRRRGVLFYIARPESPSVLEETLYRILRNLTRGDAQSHGGSG
jgi:DNA-binding NtrC family response regulator